MKFKHIILFILIISAAIGILYISSALTFSQDSGLDTGYSRTSFFTNDPVLTDDTRIIDKDKVYEWEKDFYTADPRLMADENMQAGLIMEIPGGMELISSDGDLELNFNKKTTEFAIRNKKTGAIWTSGPHDKALDKVAAGNNLNKLASLITLDYYTLDGSLQSFDSYNNSVRQDNFTTVLIPGGVRIVFEIGNRKEVTSNDVPNVISKKRFESFLSKLPGSKMSDTKNRYRLYSLSKAKNEKEKEQLIKDYPAIVKNDVYVLKNKDDKLLPIIKENLELAGYTAEDLELDNRENNINTKTFETEIFKVTLEIRLENNRLIAEIDGKEFRNPKKTPIYNIHVLPNFGAANLKSRGYMLVPDGSGGLVYLNSFSTGNETVRLPLYGRDWAIRTEETGNPAMQNCMPIYGIKNDDQGFLAIIEKGDGCASVNFSTPGLQNSYNLVWPSFNINPSDTYEAISGNYMGSAVNIMMYPEEFYSDNLKITYSFHNGEGASYPGFAREYRKYLQSSGKITPAGKKEDDIAFVLETIGAIDKPESLMGFIKYNKIITMTTFEQTQEIVKRLQDAGVRNIALRLSGWMNSGMSQTPADKIDVVRELGDVAGLSQLLGNMQALGVTTYADVSLQTIRNPGILYSKKNNAVKYLGNVYAMVNRYDLPSGMKLINVSPEYLLTPSGFKVLSEKIGSAYKRLSLTGISVNDLGISLYSDFDPADNISRDRSKEFTVEALDITADGCKLMIETGNSYAIKNADKIVNIPIGGSGYRSINETVPFYQMVLHGYIDYSGEPLNHADDPVYYSLKCMEYGANPYFQWSYAPSSLTKATSYNYLYSLHYKNTFESAVQYYNRLNEEAGILAGLTITGHERVAQNVYITTYEGGYSTIVNYNKHGIVLDGVEVKALDWTVMKGAAINE